jgi:hypothetical protein
MKHLKRFNESKKDKIEISELIKRKNDGEKLTDDEMYLVHRHFYETSKEYKDHYNKMIDKLLNKDKK